MTKEQRSQALRDLEKARELMDTYEYKSEMWSYYNLQVQRLEQVFQDEEVDDRFGLREWR